MSRQHSKLNFSAVTLISFLVTVVLSSSSESTLQLVHVLFRHGDRTTDRKTLYPKDPHFNETYYPYGSGELTNKGKQREFRLGKALRKRYDKFLGAIYTPDIIEAWTSDSNRTKASLQLVLAGLFPPSKEQIWETGLNWQPIPFNMIPYGQDTLFYGFFCPKYKELYCELAKSRKFAQQFEQNSKEFEYIAVNTGLKVKSYFDVFFLYMCLLTEEEFGLTLPDWTNKIYPQPLRDFAIKSYSDVTATSEMRRLASGTLLRKIVDSTQSKVKGQSPLKDRKIFLYSGHEFNIAHLLQTLEVFNPHIPPYGSYVSFELHKIDEVYGFKIFYQDYSSPEPKLLKLPACDQFCPLDNFILLLEEYLPENEPCKPEFWQC